MCIRDSKIRWRFINGLWKICNSCKRRVHLPVEWTLCRKCANRFDLGFRRLEKKLERVRVTVKEWASSPKVVLDDEFYVPILTLKDKETYTEFLDHLLIERIRRSVERKGHKLLVLPKDKVIEYYSNKVDRPVSFSEYLFACDEEKLGREICLLMKLYVLDKRTRVLWRLRKDADGLKIVKEYVLTLEGVLRNDELREKLVAHGFTPLVYTTRSTWVNI